MNKTTKLKLLSIIFLLITTMQLMAKNQDERTIAMLQVDDYYEKQIELSALAPEEYWTLLVLDSNLSSSHRYIEKLQQQKVDLSSTIIALINSKNTKETYFDKYQVSIQSYSWVNSTQNNLLKKLDIIATPVVLGMYNDTVQWQRSGVPQNFKQLKLLNKQIHNWNLKKAIK